MLRGHLLAIVVGLGLSAFALPASATERHFAFTYETGVLQPGEAEFEPWTTFRVGRERYYSRVDNRLEFELGLTERLQTALYWNFSTRAADSEDLGTGQVTRDYSFDFATVASEWKYKLSDPVADALGSALYVEGALGPVEAGIEAKLLLDKQLGKWLLATNLVFEHEWEFAVPGRTVREIELELPLAIAYFVSPSFSAGLELVPTAEIYDGELETIAFYAGPSIGAAYDSWWLSLALLPQVFSPKNLSDETFDLDHGEHLRARLLLGFHL
jgi:hypothetical protein